MHILKYGCVLTTLTYTVLSASSVNAQETGRITVSISDNVIVINSNVRSGQIDLVNGSDDPVEFTVSSATEMVGIVNPAAPILRWAPERSVALAHRSQAFRVAARPTPELKRGEYAYQFKVRAELQRDVPDILVVTDDATQDKLITALVPVVPLLPVTVYVRHGIEAPRVDLRPLTLTPDDPESLGYFVAVKQYPDRSFVGTVQVVDADTGLELSRGRLHLGQEGSEAKVAMPRGLFPTEKVANFCLKVWDLFPSQGEPYANSCSNS